MTSVSGPGFLHSIRNVIEPTLDPTLVENTPRLLDILNRSDRLARLLGRRDAKGYTLLHLAAEKNQPESLKCLLIKEANPNVVSTSDSHEVTPLHVAAGLGHLACLQLLVQSGGDVLYPDNQHRTPLDYAVLNGQDLCLNFLNEEIAKRQSVEAEEVKDVLTGEMAKQKNGIMTLDVAVFQMAICIKEGKVTVENLNIFLEEQHLGINECIFSSRGKNLSALMLAVAEGQVEVVELLIKKCGANANLTNENGWSALMIASGMSEFGAVHKNIVNMLLEQDVNIDLQNDDGMSALMLACKDGHIGVAILLLERDAKVNLKDIKGRSALMLACENWCSEIVELLLKGGADINQTNEDGVSALMVASNCHVAKLLLENGATVNLQNRKGWSALMFACYMGNLEMVELLLKNGADSCLRNKEDWSLLMIACNSKDTDTIIDVIKLLLKEENTQVNQQNEKGSSALMVASDCEVAELLLEEGASIDLQNNDGWTALMFACQNKNLKMVELLLRNGANTNLQNNEKSSLLMIACKNFYHHNHSSKLIIDIIKIIKLLLKEGVQVDQQNEKGTSALMVASDFEVAELLLEEGASIDLQNNDGWTALMFACQNKNLKTVELLLKNGVNTNLQNNEKSSLLMIACEYLYHHNHSSKLIIAIIKIIKLLLKEGVQVDQQNEKGTSALMVASDFEVAELLLEEGASIDLQNNDGWTALMFACHNKNLKTVELLLKNGANANLQNNKKSSLLMITCEYLYHHNHSSKLIIAIIKIIKLLLKEGVQVDQQNEKGTSALMVASDFEVAELLLEEGASIDLQNNDGWTALMFACQNKNLKTVELLLKNGANTNLQNNKKSSLLMITCEYNHSSKLIIDIIKIIKLLLKEGVQVDQQNEKGTSALMVASDFEVAELLLEEGASIDLQNNDGWTALMFACQNKNLKTVELLLKNGANTNLQNSKKSSPLMIACEYFYHHSELIIIDIIKIIKLLLKEGVQVDQKSEEGASDCEVASIDLQNNDGWTALMFACQMGNLKVVELLLKNGANLNLQNTKKLSLLMIACGSCQYYNNFGRIGVIKFLLKEENAQVDQQNDEGSSALMMTSNCEVAEVLLENGASIDLQNYDGWTALMFACQKGNLEMVKFLLKNNASINLWNNKSWSHLMIACDGYNYGNDDVVKFLLKEGAEVDQQNQEGLSALMITSECDVAKILLENGASIDLQNNDGWTALMFACQKGNLEMVKFLLKNNANINLWNNKSWSHLMIACDGYNYGNDDVVKFLLKEGYAEVDQQNQEGLSALMIASDCKVAKVLLQEGASIDLQNNDGWTALMFACQKGNLEMVKFLLQNNANINLWNNKSWSLLMIACYGYNYGNDDVVKFLLKEAYAQVDQQNQEGLSALMITSDCDVAKVLFEEGASIDLQNNDGWTALMLACQKGNLEMVKFLLKNGKNAQLDQQNQEGLSPLMIACKTGYYEVAKLLLEHGASIDKQSNDGWSALMFACRKGNKEIVELLLEKNANVNLQAKRKWSALMIACESNHQDIINMLLQKKAEVNIGLPLKIASEHGNFIVVEQLLKSGAQIDASNDKGWTPLMSASKGGHSDVVKHLLDNMAKVDLQNNKGFTALMITSIEGHNSVIQLLLDREADTDLQSPKGESAMSLATFYGHADVVSKVVSHICLTQKDTISGMDEEATLPVDDLEFPSVDFQISRESLNLIKWKDTEGNIHSFCLIAKASMMWREIGKVLNYSEEELEAICHKWDGKDAMCWYDLIEKWLYAEKPQSDSTSWKGLYDLLVDAGATDAARFLRKVLKQAIQPPTFSLIVEPCSENPAFNENEQQRCFRDNRPIKPPDSEFQSLKALCAKVEFIFQVVNENEYQAAVTLLKPPKSTSFTRPVVFPGPGNVVGEFGDKNVALIHTEEGFDCSDYVQDAINNFPNAQFVVSVGYGYAFDSDQHKLGDVLISRQISDLKNLSFDSDDRLTDRGQTVNVIKTLSSIFCKDLGSADSFEVSDTKRYSQVSTGQFASLPVIIENKKMRDKIHDSLPKAIGGDMEGGQLLNFRLKGKIKGVVVIKGVSNYADGSTGKEWEFTASLAAFHYANSKLYYYSSESEREAMKVEENGDEMDRKSKDGEKIFNEVDERGKGSERIVDDVKWEDKRSERIVDEARRRHRQVEESVSQVGTTNQPVANATLLHEHPPVNLSQQEVGMHFQKNSINHDGPKLDKMQGEGREQLMTMKEEFQASVHQITKVLQNTFEEFVLQSTFKDFQRNAEQITAGEHIEAKKQRRQRELQPARHEVQELRVKLLAAELRETMERKMELQILQAKLFDAKQNQDKLQMRLKATEVEEQRKAKEKQKELQDLQAQLHAAKEEKQREAEEKEQFLNDLLVAEKNLSMLKERLRVSEEMQREAKDKLQETQAKLQAEWQVKLQAAIEEKEREAEEKQQILDNLRVAEQDRIRLEEKLQGEAEAKRQFYDDLLVANRNQALWKEKLRVAEDKQKELQEMQDKLNDNQAELQLKLQEEKQREAEEKQQVVQDRIRLEEKVQAATKEGKERQRELEKLQAELRDANRNVGKLEERLRTVDIQLYEKENELQIAKEATEQVKERLMSVVEEKFSY